MTLPKIDALTRTRVHDLIATDLQCAVDDADLRRRLAMNGYGFRDDADRRVLVTLPHMVEILDLPRRALMN
ncbi:hypothetical protein VK792_10245 [Mesobacterium sp. TK19101]|uniref:Uncharacterized protein n=1 Tax=Mesobacterium hydrothermale TaxID=3111907 RepID=A0ABU6HKH8_9RHOB|nr:hypothetical protein [Mesobacterium sp. TK19101]MEC3861665.1 hypothetical protein [Mesobacterium sp. TK19101]